MGEHMTIRREWKLGTHSAHFEQPDILWVKIEGETTMQDAVSLSEIYGELGNQHPFFVVTDLREATSVDSEARDYVARSVNPAWFLGSVYIGAGFVQKAVAKSLAFVHYLTGRLTFDLHFVGSEEEARELLARERSHRSARVA
jgi:FAD/FMN-containing dehydrogenase